MAAFLSFPSRLSARVPYPRSHLDRFVGREVSNMFYCRSEWHIYRNNVAVLTIMHSHARREFIPPLYLEQSTQHCIYDAHKDQCCILSGHIVARFQTHNTLYDTASPNLVLLVYVQFELV